MSFYSWIRAEDSGMSMPVLRIDGVIDTGLDWWDDKTTPRNFKRALDEHPGAICVQINSPGGDVFAGADIYNMLILHGQITVQVTGLAASAASYIAQAADPGKLQIMRGASMMIHNPWTYAGGDAQELRHQAEVLDTIRDGMIELYMTRFRGTREELIALLDAETYVGADRAVELGLADVAIGRADLDGRRRSRPGEWRRCCRTRSA